MIAVFFKGANFSDASAGVAEVEEILKAKDFAGCVLDDNFFEDCLFAFNLMSNCAGFYYSAAEGDRLREIAGKFASFLNRENIGNEKSM